MENLNALGLRKIEDEKFLNFIKVIQEKAKFNKHKFYLDAGAANEKKLNNLSLSDLYGWLIPEEQIQAFEVLYFNNKVIPESFDVYYTLETWELKDNNLIINFN